MYIFSSVGYWLSFLSWIISWKSKFALTSMFKCSFYIKLKTSAFFFYFYVVLSVYPVHFFQILWCTFIPLLQGFWWSGCPPGVSLRCHTLNIAFEKLLVDLRYVIPKASWKGIASYLLLGCCYFNNCLDTLKVYLSLAYQDLGSLISWEQILRWWTWRNPTMEAFLQSSSIWWAFF